MVDIGFYKKYLNLNSVDEICESLSKTLVETNCTYNFFVDWTKVIRNRDSIKYEVALLKSMRNSTNPIFDMENLLIKYPEVIRAIPILLACRDGFIKVLDSIEQVFSYKEFDFSKDKYTSTEIEELVYFVKKTGLLDMLCKMESATDYLLGVEVGLDTNARKNRSGLFLEKIVTETIEKLCNDNTKLIFIKQKSFGHVRETYNIKIPTALADRKFDYAIINEGKATTIEVNFYGGTGSKPSEIVSSYINRGQELSSAGWKFVWLTDGIGWKKMQNPLHIGVENISYVLNLFLLRKGMIEKIILTQ